MDRGAWWATVHGVTKGSDTTEQLTVRKSGGKRMGSHTPKFFLEIIWTYCKIHMKKEHGKNSQEYCEKINKEEELDLGNSKRTCCSNDTALWYWYIETAKRQNKKS